MEMEYEILVLPAHSDLLILPVFELVVVHVISEPILQKSLFASCRQQTLRGCPTTDLEGLSRA